MFSLRGAVCVQPKVGSACGERLPVLGPGVGAACVGPVWGGLSVLGLCGEGCLCSAWIKTNHLPGVLLVACQDRGPVRASFITQLS